MQKKLLVIIILHKFNNLTYLCK